MRLTAPNKRRIEAYRSANEEAARIIVGDIAKYGGEGSLMVQWARSVIERAYSTLMRARTDVEALMDRYWSRDPQVCQADVHAAVIAYRNAVHEHGQVCQMLRRLNNVGLRRS